MGNEPAEKLAAYGIDYGDAMDRFGDNAELYERLALKYLNDKHFVNMKAAMEVGDYDKAYAEAHALKGVAGNLSLTNLFTASSMLCESLRHGEAKQAEDYLPVVEQAHESALSGLEAWSEGML